MTYEELKKILDSSCKEDWLFNDSRGIYTYKNNLNIRIQRKDIDFESDAFEGEEWATKHPDPKAYREIYGIYYGSSFIEERLLVTVDGFRATLPLPKIKTNKIKQQDYQFARIVDRNDSLDEYIRRAGLEVSDD